jgi:hypothetical protein
MKVRNGLGCGTLSGLIKTTAQGGYAQGAKDGEPAVREISALEAGFTCFRRAAETPFNLVYKIRP